MKPWKRNKKNRGGGKNSRINIILAIIFLFGLVALYQLYSLQVFGHERYAVLALKQQQVYSKLEPQRGRIFIQDTKEESLGGELFPLATNKKFALVYAKPVEITRAPEVADGLYEIFNRQQVEKEVDDLLAMDDELKAAGEQFAQIKREAEIKLRKEKVINNYLTVLSKHNDPYEPIAKKVDDETLNKLMEMKLQGIDYIMEEHRFYPEKNIASNFIGFVGFAGDERRGLYGLEGFFNEELSGKAGSFRADKNAKGDIIIINEQEYDKPEDGSDLILTINRSIEFEACRKLNEAVLRHGAEGGSVIIMEPQSGAIIAMCSSPDYDPNAYQEVKEINNFNNPAIFHQYEPGSTFKTITMAAALDQGKVTPNTTYEDKGAVMIEGWPKPIKNSDYDSSGGHGIINMNEVLEKSLNTGAIFAAQKVGAPLFAKYIKDFGFGEKTGIELETETPGDINNLSGNKIRPINAATASFGQGLTATSLQMITAYAAIANGGILMKPYLVKEIVNPSGARSVTTPKQIRRAISERAATLLTAMLVNAVENGHAQRAKVPGFYVAGKTGTAQVAAADKRGYSDKTIHTFIGFAPIDEPKFVMLTKLDDPKDARFAESTAVPLFGEIAKFVLEYYQIETER